MRCYHAHPNLEGQTCNALLYEGFIEVGQIVIRCWRCKTPVTIDTNSPSAISYTQVSTIRRDAPRSAEPEVRHARHRSLNPTH